MKVTHNHQDKCPVCKRRNSLDPDGSPTYTGGLATVHMCCSTTDCEYDCYQVFEYKHSVERDV